MSPDTLMLFAVIGVGVAIYLYMHNKSVHDKLDSLIQRPTPPTPVIVQVPQPQFSPFPNTPVPVPENTVSPVAPAGQFSPFPNAVPEPVTPNSGAFPPVVTPAIPQVPSPSAPIYVPNSPGYTMVHTPPVGGSAAGSTYPMSPGVTYTFVLPATRTGAGSVNLGGEGGGGVGTNAQYEVSFTKVPGDWDTAFKTPYYTQSGAYAYLIWVPSGTGGAVIPPGETWYCNVRIAGVPPGNVIIQIPQQ